MKRALAATFAALLMIGSLAGAAAAAPNNQWDVWNINSAGTMYKAKPAPGGADSIANFTFPSTTTLALLTTSQDKALTGDLTGKTLTATFTINGSDGAAFTYDGAPGACGLNGPYVRLYFTGNPKAKFSYSTVGYTKYWWSNPIHVDLTAGLDQQLVVPLDTANWSDWGGELASAVPMYFTSAVQTVTSMGLSFGGGCFFANGVGMSAGSASFSLTSFTVAP